MKSKMKLGYLVIAMCSMLLLGQNSFSQGVAINENQADPHASAILDVSSTDKGILVPRMSTAQRTAIGSPAKGLMVFDNDLNQFWFYNGTGWAAVGGGDNIYTANGTLSGNRTVTQNNNDLTFTTGTGKVKVDGTLQMSALYSSFRSQALPLAVSDWTATDFTIRITGTGNLELPNPATNSGRVICVRNGESTARTFTTNAPTGNSSISGNRGMMLQSDGTNWHVIGGF